MDTQTKNSQNTVDTLNPWKGLDFYKETDILYGRDIETDLLFEYIRHNTQVVLYGRSGIGKSSILNAGIFPMARKERMAPIAIKLSHSGQVSYIDQIKDSIKKAGVEAYEIRPAVNAEKESLWEYFHRHQFFIEDDRVTLLVVFDQFEEIFTLQNDEQTRKSFFAELADLINNVMPAELVQQNASLPAVSYQGDDDNEEKNTNDINLDIDLGIDDESDKEKDYLSILSLRVVFTIREDFLSHLERYTSHIPPMRDNRFALLPLNEEQAFEVILRPRPGLVDADVAKLIISKVTGKSDFEIDGVPEIEVDAAVLSLYLSRLFDEMVKRGETHFTDELVERAGTNIIQQFYEDCITHLPFEKQKELEYQLLTSNNRRDNISRSDFVSLGFTEDEIHYLVDEVKLLRQFSMRDDLRLEFIHDILCPIVANRVEDRKKNLEVERLRQQEQSLYKKNRRLISLIGYSAALLCLLGLLLWDGLCNNVTVHYGQTIKRNGWFEGLERITSEEASFRGCHFDFLYKGRWSKRPYAMEARNGYGKLTTLHTRGTYIVNQFDDSDLGVDSAFVEKLKSVCRWEFVINHKGDFVVQERALDSSGNLIYTYNKAQTNDPSKVIGSYYDDYGFPLMIRDSSYLYVRTTYDYRGFEVLHEFFDDSGYPVTNKDGVYQTRHYYLDNGVEDAQFSCGIDGRRAIDRFNNCGWYNREYDDDRLLPKEVVFVDNKLNPKRSTRDSVIVSRYSYDDHKRLTEISYWDDENDRPDTSAYGYHAICFKFNRYGEIIEQSYRDIDGNPCYSSHDNEVKLVRDYDDQGRVILQKDVHVDHFGIYRCEYSNEKKILEEVYDVHTTPSGLQDTTFLYRFYLDEDDNSASVMSQGIFSRHQYDSRNNLISISYWDETNTYPVEIDGIHSNEMDYQYYDDNNGSQTIIIDRYLNCNSEAVNCEYGWARQEVRIDSSMMSKCIVQYDKNDKFISGAKCVFDDKELEHRVVQESINENFKTVRTYDNGAFYYRLNFIYSVKPSINKESVGFFALNEFGEASLVKEGGLLYHAKYKDIYFDENNNKIDPISYRSPLLAEVILNKDAGHSFAFEDGDILIQCNDWFMGDIEDIEYSFYEPFNDISCWETEKDREFTVARFNQRTEQYDTVHVFVPRGVDIEDHFSLYKFPASYEEIERIKNLIHKYIWKTVVHFVPAGNTSVAHKAGIKDAYIISYNGWNFFEDDPETFYDALNGDTENTLVCWDKEAREIKMFKTDAAGIKCDTDRIITPSFFRRIAEGYLKWKETQNKTDY